MELKKQSTMYQTFTDDLSNEDSQANGTTHTTKEDKYTIEDAIEAVGFGRFQIKVSFVAAFSWIADSMEVMVLSILGPAVLCQWRLSSTQEALITTIVFIGFMVGAPVFGVFADKYGRKSSLMFCAAWALFYGVLSGLAPSYVWLLILRCLTGVGISGVPQSVTYYSEFLPSKIRGRCIILLELYWALGALLEVGLALLVLVPYGWRYWLIASAAPLLLFIPLFLCVPESPRYSLVAGRYDEAVKTLAAIAKENRATLPRGHLEAKFEAPRGKFLDLFSPNYKRTTILLWVIWFVGGFCYYGIVLLCTELVRLDSPVGGTQCYIDCATLTHDDYIQLLWTSAAEIPGLVITAVCVDTLGRKFTMGVEFFLFMVMTLLLFVCQTGFILTLTLFVARALAASALQVLYLYTPEVYPTNTRAVGIGWACGSARIGAIITPFVAQVLLQVNVRACLGVYAGVAILGTVCVVLLPLETRGRKLTESR